MRAFAAILLALTVVGARATEPATPYDVKQAPWPTWRGPYFNGSAPELGLKLIDDIGQAPLLWTSDMPIPAAHPGSGGVRGYWCGGYSSPIVAEGRVYVAYWTPPGRTAYTHTAEDADPKHRVTRRNPVKGRSDLTADDVLHCFDAATGKTIFRTVVAGKGVMRAESKSGSHLTPCWWAGKVYFSGSAGRIHCLDATTGEVLWEEGAGTAAGPAKAPPSGVNYAAPVAIDDVVAVPNRSALIAYDAARGKVLWRVPAETTVSVATPWRHGSTGYFLCGGKLIEAKTGAVRWSIPRPPGAVAPLAISGDVLVMPNRGGTWRSRGVTEAEAPQRSMTAFRITPEKYTQLWQLPFPSPHGSQFNPAFIHRGNAYGRMYRHPESGDKEEVFVRVALDSGTAKVLLTGRKNAISGYSPIAFEGRLLKGNASGVLAVEGTGKSEVGPGAGQAANSTSCAYADGLLYFRTESNTDARLVCYDLRAAAKRREDGRAAAKGPGR